MTAKPAGLGDSSTPDFVLVKEEFPLPKSRKEIVDAVAHILQSGGVQRLTIALQEPISVLRAVPKGEVQTPVEIPPDELLLAARGATIHEFNFDIDVPSYEHLFRAFAWMSTRRLKPRALLVHSLEELRTWIEVDAVFDLSTVFDVEVKVDPELPEDTVLFLGIVPGRPERIEAGLRLSMNLPPKGA